MEFFRNIKIDFISRRKVSFILSTLLILAGIGAMVYRGGPNWGIDFTGGALIQLRFSRDFSTPELREILVKYGMANSSIQRFATGNRVILRTKGKDMAARQLAEKLSQGLKEEMRDNEFVIERNELVGPVIGKYLVKQAFLAFSLAFFAIIFYVGIRFKGGIWGVAGVIALIHDVFIVLGLLTILNREITLTVIAALLTLAGYSINDTIVIYDRIRENLKIFFKQPLLEVFNNSINQTLSRTVVTSLTTLLVVVILFFFGGTVIHDFSLALVLGVLVGTYSSVFVASPIVYEAKLRQK